MTAKPQKNSRNHLPRELRLEAMPKEILDVDGAAGILGVSKKTVYQLAKDGEIPARKVGKEWRFARRNIIKWLEEGANHNDLAALFRAQKIRAAKRSPHRES